jgi:hypothetical protein
MQDRELLLLPLFSTLSILVVMASFVLPLGLTDADTLDHTDNTTWTVALFAFYVVTYTISFFFQAAIVAGANERMAGGNPTLGSALGAARKRFGALLVWGVVAATVGMVIRAVEERSGIVGRLVMGLFGVVWSLATFFMVPVLVMEDRSVRASFGRSWAIFKETWGETVVGTMGIGLIGFVGMLVLALLVVAQIAAGLLWMGVLTAVGGVLLLVMLTSALQGVYVAALYRYATLGAEAAPGFDADLLASSWRPKKKRR